MELGNSSNKGGDCMRSKILVAYDGSELSKKAVQEGKEMLLTKEGSELHIVSVVSSAGPTTNIYVTENITNELANELRSELEELKEEIKEDHLDIHTKVLIDYGQRNPGHAICKFAEEQEADLIIIGSRGLGGVKRLFLGSVSNTVVQYAKSRVLIIK